MMAPRPIDWKQLLRRFVHSWQAPAALGVLLLIGMMYLLAPRRVERVVPVGGGTGWRAEHAPHRREIIWNPPGVIRDVLPRDDERDRSRFITPHLADRGGTLYFTRRLPTGRTNIYRSRLLDGRWTPGEPVEELNSEFDDVGPTLDPEGRVLYFYSNRPGGQGGFDLYVSERTETGWSSPRNLGPTINSPAHEYDPALAPDGKTLYFASNRNDRRRQLTSDETDSDEWTTTLRADLGRTIIDLYRTRRESIEADWGPAQPLTELNLPESNEGSPFVSTDGAFLYFASDRPHRPGEPRNLDLYRSRIDGDMFGEPENLGPGVNTSANETEPSLSPEGFTLLFSSDREGRDLLYESRAREVFTQREWDRPRIGTLSYGWWWTLLLLLLCGALLVVLMYYRGWLLEKVWPARFFLGSVLINALLLLLLVVWKFPDVIQIIMATEDSEPATELLDESHHQSREDGREAYEKVADLPSIEPTPVPEITRTENAPTSVPEQNDRPLPTIPLEQARALPPERVRFVAPSPPQPDVVPPDSPSTPPLVRQRTVPQALQQLADIEDPIDPQAAEMPAETDLATDMVLERQQVAAETSPPAQPAAPLPQRRVAIPVSAAPLGDLPPSESDSNLAETSPPANRLNRRRPMTSLEAVDLADDLEPILSETPGAEALAAIERPEIRIERTAIETQAAQSASTEPLLPARPLQPRADLPASPRFEEDLSRTSEMVRTPARRVARSPMIPDLDEAVAPADRELAAIPTPAEDAIPRTDIDLPRSLESSLPSLDVPVPREIGGPARDQHRVIVGELSDERNEAPPQFDPLATRLNRRRARASRVAFATDNVGMRELLVMRQSDTRKQHIELFGGTDESERAVNLGLKWLATHQEEEGHWSLQKHGGNMKSDTAATGLALLPFLAAGHTHNQPGEYQQTVARGIEWLVEQQQENGDLLSPGDGQRMYSHGIAAIALCEAYGMSRDEQLKEPARKALDFIIQAQHAGSGGWRYEPNQSADTSVVGWQLMALKSGEMAGLDVPQAVYDHVRRWLERVEGNKPVGGLFGYTGPSPTPAMTAEGLLCLQFMGINRNNPRMKAGADYLRTHLPQPNQQHTSYYWYYSTQVMYHMQGQYWETWNTVFRDLLIETQITSGTNAGTWDPRDNWENNAGRIYTTALKLLMLEVYYRHLPLYEQLDD